jgi:alkylated DNA nucleotide flippase Atl1
MKTGIHRPWAFLLAALLLAAASLSPCAPVAKPARPTVEVVGDSAVVFTTGTIVTEDDELADLLQRGRTGRDFHYVIFGVPQGTPVRLELGFAEFGSPVPGGRVFNVEINGKTVLSDFDIARAAGGPLRPVVRRFSITPKRGYIDIRFAATRGEAHIGFIRVQTAAQGFVISPQMPQGADSGAYAQWNPEAGEIYQDEMHMPWVSGFPLGGIGTGKFDLMSNGTIANLTTGNSWDAPVPEARGTFLAVAAKSRSGGGTARILRVRDRRNRNSGYAGAKTMAGAVLRPRFPSAELEFQDDSFPLQVKVGACSPIVPGDTRLSGMPVAYLTVELTNPNRYPVHSAVALSWEDVNGKGGSAVPGDLHDAVMTKGRTDSGSAALGGVFMNAIPKPEGRAATFAGDYFAGAPTSGTYVTRLLHWDPAGRVIPWWRQFERTCRLEKRGGKGTPAKQTSVAGESAVVVCATVNLAPRETRTVPFIVSWYCPEVVATGDGVTRVMTNDYATSFSSSAGVAAVARAKSRTVRGQAGGLRDMMLESNLPLWLKVRALNSLFPLVTNSVHFSIGKFALLESPKDGSGKIGSIEHRLGAASALTALFPTLAKAELECYARGQAADGSIPQSLGNLHARPFDPAPAPTPELARTAAAAFAAQVHMAFRATGDTTFGLAMLPAIRRAHAFASSEAASGPVGPAADGVTSALAAQALWAHEDALRAMGAMPRDAGESTASQPSMPVRPETDPLAMNSVNGMRADWIARWAGLPPSSSDDAEAGFAAAMAKRHGDTTSPLPVMSLAADSAASTRPLTMGPMEAYLAGEVISRGLPDQGLALLRRAYEAAWGLNHDPFGQSLFYDPATGRAAGWRSHMTAFGAWNAVAAVSGFQADVPRRTLFVNPRIPSSMHGELHMPVFAAGFQGWLDYSDATGTGTLTIRTVASEPGDPALQFDRIARRVGRDGRALGGEVLIPPFDVVEGARLDFAIRR